jgi:hypothetical protein
MDGNMTRPKIRACSIADPFILIIREDDTLGLFVGEAERGKIRRKDMSAMGEKVTAFMPTRDALADDIRPNRRLDTWLLRSVRTRAGCSKLLAIQ